MRSAVLLILLLPLAGPAAGGSLEDVDTALKAQDWSTAQKLARDWAARAPKEPAPWMKLTLALHGEQRWEEALAAIAEAKRRGAPPMWILQRTARAQLGRGRVEQSLDALEAAASQGFANLKVLQTDPELAPLRQHPRYAALEKKVDQNANPCLHRAESTQFDFWLGEWDVTSAGNPVGQSRVEKLLNGCVLQENWTSASGSGGKSFNLYDPEQRRWRQTWVDAGGNITDYAGGLNNAGAMVFTAHDAWPAQKVHLRMTFTRLGEHQVRQLIETSKDRKKWAVAFDGLYTRKAAAAAAGQ